MEEKMLKIHCSGIENGKFHIDHTGRGADRSPELILENLSPEVGGSPVAVKTGRACSRASTMSCPIVQCA